MDTMHFRCFSWVYILLTTAITLICKAYCSDVTGTRLMPIDRPDTFDSIHAYYFKNSQFISQYLRLTPHSEIFLATCK